jgi:hypothetical protein
MAWHQFMKGMTDSYGIARTLNLNLFIFQHLEPKLQQEEHNSSNFDFQGYHVDIYQYMWDLEELLEMSSNTFHIHNTSWVLLLYVKSEFLCNQRRRIIASQYNIDTVSMKNLTRHK